MVQPALSELVTDKSWSLPRGLVLTELVTDKYWSLPRGLVLTGLIYIFTLYTDESCSYYGNKSQPENILRSPKMNFVN